MGWQSRSDGWGMLGQAAGGFLQNWLAGGRTQRMVGRPALGLAEDTSDLETAVGPGVAVPPGALPDQPGIRTAWTNPVTGGKHYQVGKRSYVYVSPDGYQRRYRIPKMVVLNVHNPRLRDLEHVTKQLQKSKHIVGMLDRQLNPHRKKGRQVVHHRKGGKR